MKKVFFFALSIFVLQLTHGVYAARSNNNDQNLQLALVTTPTPTIQETPTVTPSHTISPTVSLTPTITPTIIPSPTPGKIEPTRKQHIFIINRPQEDPLGGPQDASLNPTSPPTPTPTSAVVVAADSDSPDPKNFVAKIVAPLGNLFDPKQKQYYKNGAFSAKTNLILVSFAFLFSIIGFILLRPYLWFSKQFQKSDATPQRFWLPIEKASLL